MLKPPPEVTPTVGRTTVFDNTAHWYRVLFNKQVNIVREGTLTPLPGKDGEDDSS